MKFIQSHPAFNDTIDSLKNEFKDNTENSLIICGPIDYAHCGKDISYFRNKYKNNKIIVFNQEQVNTKMNTWLSQRYIKFLSEADEVWDYDEYNISTIKKYNNHVKLHILKPYKNWPKESEKDIDILFYGSINEHRKTLLEHLATKYNVVTLYDVYDLDSYILRSKVLLNIHYYYDCALQEQARMIRWIGAPCRIISEKSRTNYLGVEEMTYESLFDLKI